MADTITFQTGDGIVNPLIVCSVGLPDSGNSVAVIGTVSYQGTTVSITGSPVTVPAAPGSGSTYFIIQVNKATGAATVKQSSTGTPSPDAGNVTVFGDVLAPANTDLALDASEAPTIY